MLLEEAKIIRCMVQDLSNKKIINLCSSDSNFYKIIQPHIWSEVLSPLFDRGNVVHSLDIKIGEGIDIVADCADMSAVDSGVYDVALFFSGIEHIVNVDAALKETKRILKKNGVLFCSAPGVYPLHNDPIDTMLRLPTIDAWSALLKNDWEIRDFKKTTPIPAMPAYKFKELVYATIVKVVKKSE